MKLLLWALTTGCGSQWEALDLDGDGSAFGEDCDETNPNIGPNAVEDWYNGIDENCDGNDADKDGDGFVPQFYADTYPNWADFPAHVAVGDCWDDPQEDAEEFQVVGGQGHTQPTAAEVHPDAEDKWYDGPDQDCGGEDDFDADGDGYASAFHVNRTGAEGDDCFDIVSDDFPDEGFAPLIADGCVLDVDKDGIEDELPVVDDPASVHPDADDTWYDGIDQNCDGNDWDQDGDFQLYFNPDLAETDSQCDDCDDSDPDIYPDPSVVEVWYNGIDENCDNNDADMDRDNYVDQAYIDANPNTWQDANQGKLAGDCWDDLSDPGTGEFTPLNGFDALLHEEVHPNADDVWYDGIDADCAGNDDFDQDGDGYSSDAYDSRTASPAGDDCDDTLSAVNIAGTEDCDTAYDDDCDGDTNDFNALNSTTYYYDGDEDGQGDEDNLGADYCEPHATNGYTSLTNNDCRDSDDTVYDGATELCDGQDNDCDGSVLATEEDNDSDKAVECTIDSGGWDGDDASWAVNEGDDCDDTDNKSYPSAPEICDGEDNQTCKTTGAGDSIHADEVDNDGDGYVECELDRTWQDSATANSGGEDCLDSNDDAYPGAAYEESSSSCREDADGDGYGDSSPPSGVTAGDDCDDGDNTIYAGATEVFADGIDQDCNDRDTCYRDDDEDTFGDSSGSIQSGTNLNCNRPAANMANDSDDCDDDDDTVYPNATELCDGQLNDCNGSMLTDEVDDDSDQYTVCTLDSGGWDGSGTVVGGDDCDDGDGTIYPGADELCDGQLNDCDGSIPSTETDDDSDGYVECEIDSGGWDGSTSKDGEDCDDTDDTVNPGASELCDGLDNDCSGAVASDENDDDSDGFVECTIDSGGWDGSTSKAGDDCDDTDEDVNPDGTEVTGNDTDEDCDDILSCYEDDDQDGSGVSTTTTTTGTTCDDSSNKLANDADDCDDTDDTVYPAATELCDGQLNDCDQSSLPTNEVDNDSDGFVECTIDSGGWDGSTSKDGGDCDDTDSDVNPDGTEVVADDVDDDCDGNLTCYLDDDQDGYGDEGETTQTTSGTTCDDSANSVSNNTDDCDDTDEDTYPGATETVADGVDQDCDDVDHCYTDGDGDGEGDENTAASAGNDLDCTDTGEADDNDDCDDSDADNYSSNTESCDDQDNNCNDVADENNGCYDATDLFFTEFQRSSNYGDPEGEWFEIYNNSGADVTADGWQFFKGGQSFYVAPGVLTFPADDYTTFCYSDETLGTDCDYVYGGAIDNGASDAGDTDNSSWTMGNTPNFSMWLGSDALDDVPMNSNGWSNPADGESVQFVVPTTFAETDNDDEDDWCVVDASGSTNRYYNGTGDDDDYGTPLGDADCAP